MKNLLPVVVGLVMLALAACQTTDSKSASAEAAAPLPEIRYYVIADT